ncbi:MAG: hypothetical protein AAFN10_27635 [Bacteroidota bacterium]
MQRSWRLIWAVCLFLLFVACEKPKYAWEAIPHEQIELAGDIWADKPIGKELSVPDLGPENIRLWQNYVRDSMSLLGQADLIPLSLALFLEERQSRYIEVLERSLWNDGLIGAYRTGDSTYHPGDFAFVSGPDSLFANIYVAGSAELSVNGQTLRISTETRYPWEEIVQLKIETCKAIQFTLGLRIPGASRNLALPDSRFQYLYSSNRKLELRVNEDLIMPATEEGYAFVTRTWQAGDKVELRLPLAVRRVQNKDVPSLIALERGPILYGFPQENVPLDMQLSKSRQYFLMDSLDGSIRLNWLRGPIWQDGQMIEAEAAPLYYLQAKEIEALPYSLTYR